MFYVRYFLEQFGFSISDIHLLEPALMKKLSLLESQNVIALFESSRPRDSVVAEIDNCTDRLDESVC